MLSKRRRIPRHHFPFDSRVGKTLHAEHLSLRIVPSVEAHFRVSVVVSKKTVQSSVDRHKVKRRVYDSVDRINTQKALPAARYIFFGKKGIGTIPFKTIHTEAALLLGRIANND